MAADGKDLSVNIEQLSLDVERDFSFPHILFSDILCREMRIYAIKLSISYVLAKVALLRTAQSPTWSQHL